MKNDSLYNKKSQISIFFFLSILIFVTIVFISTTSQRINREVLEVTPSRFAKDFFSGLDLERSFRRCAESSVTSSLYELSYGGYILDEEYSLYNETDFRFLRYSNISEYQDDSPDIFPRGVSKIPFLIERFHSEDYGSFYEVPDWPCNNITGRDCVVDLNEMSDSFVYASRPRSLYDTIFEMGGGNNYFFIVPPLTSERVSGIFGTGVPTSPPFNNSWEKQLSYYVENRVRDCMNLEHYEESGYVVEERSDVFVDIDIGRDDVVFDIRWPIEIMNHEGSESLSISNVKMVKDVSLKRIYDFIEELANELRRNYHYDLTKKPYNYDSIQSTSLYIDEVYRKIDGDNNFIKIVDSGSNLENSDYSFYIPLQNRPPILETLEFPELQSQNFDISILAGDDLTIKPDGIDPDSDSLEFFYYGFNAPIEPDDSFGSYIYSEVTSAGYDFDDYYGKYGDNEWMENDLFLEGSIDLDDEDDIYCNNERTGEIDDQRCSYYETDTSDIGQHKLVVGVRESATHHSIDWQVLDIVVDNPPEPEINIRDMLSNTPEVSFLSIEEPFILDGNESDLGVDDEESDYFWEENLTNKEFTFTDPVISSPFELNPGDDIDIFNIDDFTLFNKTGDVSIFLTVKKELSGSEISVEEEYNTEVRECMPYSDETSINFEGEGFGGPNQKIAAPFPFNHFEGQKNFSSYYSIPDFNFEGSNKCCDNDGNIKSNDSVCYEFEYVVSGMPPYLSSEPYLTNVTPWNLSIGHNSYEKISSVITDFSDSDFSLKINEWNYEEEDWLNQENMIDDLIDDYEIDLLDNSFYCRRITVQCDGERGNICSGDAVERWGLMKTCEGDASSGSSAVCDLIQSEFSGAYNHTACDGLCVSPTTLTEYKPCENIQDFDCDVTDQGEVFHQDGQFGGVCYNEERAFLHVDSDGKRYTETDLIDNNEQQSFSYNDEIIDNNNDIGTYICNSTCDGSGNCDWVIPSYCTNCNELNDIVANKDDETCTFYNDSYSIGENPGQGECEFFTPETDDKVVNCTDLDYNDIFNESGSIYHGASGIVSFSENSCEWAERGVLEDPCENGPNERPVRVMEEGNDICDWGERKENCCGTRLSADPYSDNSTFYCNDLSNFSEGKNEIKLSIVNSDDCSYPNVGDDVCEVHTLECNSDRVCNNVSEVISEVKNDKGISDDFENNWNNIYDDYVCHAANDPSDYDGEKYVWKDPDNLPPQTNATDGYDNNCDGGIDCESYHNDTKGRLCELGSNNDGVCLVNDEDYVEGNIEYNIDMGICDNTLCKRNGELVHSNLCEDGDYCMNFDTSLDVSYPINSSDLFGVWSDSDEICHEEGPFYFDDGDFEGQDLTEFNRYNKDWSEGCDDNHLCIREVDDLISGGPAEGICYDDDCYTGTIFLSNNNRGEYNFDDIVRDTKLSYPCIRFDSTINEGFMKGFYLTYESNLFNRCYKNDYYVFYKDSLYLDGLYDYIDNNFLNDLPYDDFDFYNTVDLDQDTEAVLCGYPEWGSFEEIGENFGLYSEDECCDDILSFSDFNDQSQSDCGCDSTWDFCFDYNLDYDDDFSNRYFDFGRCVNNDCCSSNEIVFQNNDIGSAECTTCDSNSKGDYCYILDDDGSSEGDYGICSQDANEDYHCSTNIISEDNSYSECDENVQGDELRVIDVYVENGEIDHDETYKMCAFNQNTNEFDLVNGTDEKWASREDDGLNIKYPTDPSHTGYQCDNIENNEWNYDSDSQNTTWVDDDVSICAICNSDYGYWDEFFDNSNLINADNDTCSEVCGADSECDERLRLSESNDFFCDNFCSSCDIVSNIDSSNNFEFNFNNNNFKCGCEDISKEDEFYYCNKTGDSKNRLCASDDNEESVCSNDYLVDTSGDFNLNSDDEIQSCEGIAHNHFDIDSRLCNSFEREDNNDGKGLCANNECHDYVVIDYDNGFVLGPSYGADGVSCRTFSDENNQIMEGIVIDDECVYEGYFTYDGLSESFDISENFDNICVGVNDLTACGSVEEVVLEGEEVDLDIINDDSIDEVGFCYQDECMTCGNENYITDIDVFDDSSNQENPYGTCHQLCDSQNECVGSFAGNSVVDSENQQCLFCNSDCEYSFFNIEYDCNENDLDQGYCHDEDEFVYFSFYNDENNFCDDNEIDYDVNDVYTQSAYTEGLFVQEIEDRYFNFFLSGYFYYSRDNSDNEWFLYSNPDSPVNSYIDLDFILTDEYIGDFYYDYSVDHNDYSPDKKSNLRIFPKFNEDDLVCEDVYDSQIYDDEDLNEDNVNLRSNVDCPNYFYNYSNDETSSILDRKYVGNQEVDVYEVDINEMENFACVLTDCIFKYYDNVLEISDIYDSSNRIETLNETECFNYETEEVIDC